MMMRSGWWGRRFRGGVLALALASCASGGAAWAQAIVATANGDPITSADVEQEVLLRRILRRPATRDDALEDLVADRLKLREANKYGVDANETDLSQTLNHIASQAGMNPQTLSGALQKSKASTEIIRDHLRAVAAWTNYVKARNKTLNVSEEEVSSALAKDPGKAQDATELTLQEVVLVTPTGASAGEVEQRTREAQALRSRFTDCGSGLALARGLPNVAIKQAFRRNAKGLSDSARKSLDATPSGHLTMPERTVTGVQMIAVCAKDQDNRSTIRDNVQADLLANRLTAIGDKMYKDLRASAVVEKR